MRSTTMHMDFVGDLRLEYARRLQEAGYTVDVSKLSAHEVATRYLNALRRRVARRRRKIRRARQFLCPRDLVPGLEFLEKRVVAGEELAPHQSRRILDVEWNDGVLNDWGIHHFHLGTAPHADDRRFVARTGPVLYARVMRDTFDMIDVRGHGTWHHQELIQIVHDNWPESLVEHRADSSVVSADKWTDESVKTLRKINANYMLSMPDGTIYHSPGGGQQSSGLSTAVLMAADRQLSHAKACEDGLRENIDQFRELAREAGFEVEQSARICLRVTARSWVAEHASTGFGVEVFRFPREDGES